MIIRNNCSFPRVSGRNISNTISSLDKVSGQLRLKSNQSPRSGRLALRLTQEDPIYLIPRATQLAIEIGMSPNTHDPRTQLYIADPIGSALIVRSRFARNALNPDEYLCFEEAVHAHTPIPSYIFAILDHTLMEK